MSTIVPEPTQLQLPHEPCVVIWDGELAVVVTDRTCQGVVEWARRVGPIARPIMATRLRAIADHIERSVERDA